MYNVNTCFGSSILIFEMKKAYNPATESRESYIGNVRYQLLQHYQLGKTDSIVEIAPGGTPKIGLGLRQLGFSGTIYIIEPDLIALATITKVYKDLLPGATIIGINRELSESIPYLPTKVKAILSNHPLDDMIISYAKHVISTDTYYSKCYENAELSQYVWNCIARHSEKLPEILHCVRKDWADIMRHTQPDFAVISQYKSYYYQSNGIYLADNLAQLCLHSLAIQYGDHLEKNEILENNGQDSGCWLVMTQFPHHAHSEKITVNHQKVLL